MEKENRIKRRLFTFLSSRMVYNGYVVGAARKWKESVFNSLVGDHDNSLFFKLKSYRYGFLPEQMKFLKVTKKNRKKFVSYRDYLYLNGANGKYSKWLADIITTDKVLKSFKDNMIDLYYQLYLRDGKIMFVSFDKKFKENMDDFYKCIKDKKLVVLMSTNYRMQVSLKYVNNKYYMNDVLVSLEDIELFIKENIKEFRSLVLTENVVSSEGFKIENNNALLFLKVYNKNGLDPLVGEVYADCLYDYSIDNEFSMDDINDQDLLDEFSVENDFSMSTEDSLDRFRLYFDEKTGKFNFSVIRNKEKLVKTKSYANNGELVRLVEKNYAEINKLICKIFKTIPQIEIAGVCLSITDNGIKIVNIFNNPAYCDYSYFNKDFSDFLKYKYDAKRELYNNFSFKFKIFRKKIWLKFCKLFAITCYPKGLVPYISFRWLRDIKDDFVQNKNIPFRTKMWAYRHGFLSYRLAQYGINKNNYKNFISDFEYKWLRHIDNYYKVWFEDKITIKYVASEYNKFFPKYYYYISLKQGENQIIPMMDCPKGYGNTYEDIIKLVKKEKDIALKRDKGSHGEGFYRLSYKNGKLYLNLEEATYEDVVEILSDKSNEYLVTEYIKQCDVLNRIYDGSVNTIRIIVFKEDGKTPRIGNAYMRFGSKKTGTVDNIGAGGIFVSLDEETGYFHDALIITDDLKIVPCEKHPDTGLAIEGYIPNWDKVIKDVLEIASHLEQIEYFGFDIAITSDGMKFPEINRYPDYMKIGKLKPHSIKYLLEKVEQKKKMYGYDKRMPRKLFKFIDRR